MKRAGSFAVALLLFLCLPTSAVAQDKPNFAGTWKLSGTAADFTPSQMVVAQDAKTLNITSTSQMGEISTPFNLDGTDLKAPLDFNGMTLERVTRAVWKGNTLVLTIVQSFQGQSADLKLVWSLEKDGTLLVEATRPNLEGGGTPVTSKSTYKKG